MARTDIAGLLTGVPSGGIDPMAVGGTPAQQRLAFGAQRAQGLQRAARGLMVKAEALLLNNYRWLWRSWTCLTLMTYVRLLRYNSLLET